MYVEHECFRTPPDETIIWRYLNFSKLVSLIDSKCLYFPNAEKLSKLDPYEGSFARGNLEYDPRTDPSFSELNEADIGRYQAIRAQMRQDVKEHHRKGIYISSWYINEQESAAMWKCYAEHEDGIAIKSTVGRLKESFASSTENIYVGEIIYVDYETSVIPENNIFFNFMHKRKSFEHEKELRVIRADFRFLDPSYTPPEGFSMHIDLERLIDSIYVAPTASEWIKCLVQSVVAKYELSFPVKKSSINEDGLW